MQSVTFNIEKWTLKDFQCGVPQKSILGLFLFLIHINNPASIYKHTLPIFFAGDSNLLLEGDNFFKKLTKIHISTWLKVNWLSLNTGKTQFMIFESKISKMNI